MLKTYIGKTTPVITLGQLGKKAHSLGVVLCSIAMSNVLFVQSVNAEIVFDGSFGETQAGALKSGQMTLDAFEGTTQGSNLFYGFSTFNINAGESLTYQSNINNQSTITDIINRVSENGGNASTINGLLSASSYLNADVWVLNPHGVVIGNGASLDINGSMFVSTGDSILFQNGTVLDDNVNQFSMDQLIIDTPEAFGFFGENYSPITVDQAEIQLRSGEELTLVGGAVNVTNSTISGDQSTVNLYGINSARAGTSIKVEGGGSLINNNDGPVTFAPITVTNSRLGVGLPVFDSNQGPPIDPNGLSEFNALGNGVTISGSTIQAAQGSQSVSLVSVGELGTGATIPSDSKNTSIMFTNGRFSTTLAPVNVSNSTIDAESDGFNSGFGSVAMIGSEVNIGNSSISASKGLVSALAINELAPLASIVASFQGLSTSDSFNLSAPGSVTIDGGSTINVVGETAGTISIRGGELLIDESELKSGHETTIVPTLGQIILEGDNIAIQTDSYIGFENSAAIASQNKADIDIYATGNVTVAGSTISNDSIAGGSSEIRVDASKLTVRDGGSISSDGSQSGGAGRVLISAFDVELDSGTITANASDQATSGTTCILASGCTNGSSFYALADSVTIKNEGAAIEASSSSSTEGAGKVFIGASDITVSGGGSINVEVENSPGENQGLAHLIADGSVTITGPNSRISGSSSGSANASSILIEDAGAIIASDQDNSPVQEFFAASQLDPRDTLQVVNTAGVGILNISVDDSASSAATLSISVDDSASVKTTATGGGNAGDITIGSANRRVVSTSLNTGSLNAESTGGAGGNIQVFSDQLTMTGGTINSGAASGSLGSINIDTDNATFTNDSLISLVSTGTAAPASSEPSEPSLQITATDINLSASTVSSSAADSSTGGKIAINSATLSLDDTSRLTTIGNGNVAGDIEVTADDISINSASEINTNVTQGTGGNVSVTANALLNISGNDSGIFTRYSSAQDGAGNLLLTGAGDLIVDQFGEVTSVVSGSGAGGNITIAMGSVSVDNNGAIITRAQDTGKGGDLQITTTRADGDIALSNSAAIIAASNFTGNSGNVSLTSQRDILMDSSASIQSVASGDGAGGNLDLNALNVKINNAAISSSADFSNGGSINITAVDNIELEDIRTGSSPNIEATHSGLGGIDVKAGDVTLQAKDIRLLGSASISGTASGVANGGDVTLSSVNGLSLVGSESRITTLTSGQGNGGNIMLTDNDTIEISVVSQIITNTTATTNGGKGGDICISAPNVTLNVESTVQALSGGSGDSGDIAMGSCNGIEASNVVVDNGTISVGSGGEIELFSNDVFVLNNANITATDGQISLVVDGSVDIANTTINTNPNDNALQVFTRLDQVTQSDNSNGKIILDSDQLQVRQSQILGRELDLQFNTLILPSDAFLPIDPNDSTRNALLANAQQALLVGNELVDGNNVQASKEDENEERSERAVASDPRFKMPLLERSDECKPKELENASSFELGSQSDIQASPDSYERSSYANVVSDGLAASDDEWMKYGLSMVIAEPCTH